MALAKVIEMVEEVAMAFRHQADNSPDPAECEMEHSKVGARAKWKGPLSSHRIWLAQAQGFIVPAGTTPRTHPRARIKVDSIPRVPRVGHPLAVQMLHRIDNNSPVPRVSHYCLH